MLALEKDEANYGIYNVGTGQPHSILEIAETVISLYRKDLEPEVTGKFRAGDIRHCYSDNLKITDILGFKPEVSFEEGMKRLKVWSETQEAEDLTEKAQEELKEKGLAE
jgi:dTDP-L-rhamnose 4-epimerase